MRGSPLLRSFIALAILLGLGFPLRYLLRADDTPAVASAPPATPAAAPITLQLSFTTAPARFAVLSLGKEIWSETAPALEVEHSLTIAWPKEGVDLQFDIAWPVGTRAAARVRLTDPQGGEYEKAVFGEGPATEVLTFP